MGALDGQCMCGETTFTCDGPAVLAAHCQCTDCQKLSGTGHMTNVLIKKGSVTLKGPVSVHEAKADSGNINKRSFCSVCGSQMLRENSGLSDVDIINGGVLKNANAVTPSVVIWHKSANAWDYNNPALPVFDKMPPKG
jgi:hypothetical protein